jgi:hypothetical protein
VTRWIATFASFLALSLPVAAASEEASAPARGALEALLTDSADEPSEHRALARYYRAQAATERARAARLRSAARHVGGGKLFHVSAARSLRQKQAETLEMSAREHDQLAQQHEARAS